MEMNRQFGRFAEVEIRDFESRVKTVIGNDFEIEFDYFKTIDQTQEDDSGRIRIFGLTPERVESLQTEGGEVRLTCGYTNSSVDLLFIASISRLYSNIENNISVTTIECSANLLNHYATGSISSDGNEKLPMSKFFYNIATKLGYSGVDFILNNVPENKKTEFKEFIETYYINLAQVGDVNTILKNLADIFSMGISKDIRNDEKFLVLTILPIGVDRILKEIDAGYAKATTSAPVTDGSLSFSETLSADVNDKTILLLDYETGLIESKTEYKIATAYADQELTANEEETLQSKNKRTVPSDDAKKDKKPNLPREDNPFVSNSTLSGLKIKSSESTSGGRVHKDTADFAYAVQSLLGGDLVYFTAFNDRFHVNRGGRHPEGKAFDVTIKSGRPNAAKVSNDIRRLAKQNGYNIKILDEYNYPSAGSTGGHIHVSVYGRNSSNESGYYENPSSSEASAISRESIKINRKYNRVKALLNPLVKPQSLVYILDKTAGATDEVGSGDLSYESVNFYRKHRVRTANYRGNNRRNDWIMDLYCEDSENIELTEEAINRLKQTNSEDDIVVSNEDNPSFE